MLTGPQEDRATFNKIVRVFEGRNDSLSVDNFYLRKEEEIFVYKSNTNPDFVEQAIRVEILMKNSDLFSYSRNGDEFTLLFHSKCDSSFTENLSNYESLSIQAFKAKSKLQAYNIEREYKGSHCIVQFLSKDYKKCVLKIYESNFMEFKECNGNMKIKSTFWQENNKLYVLQDFKDVETLEDCLKKRKEIINEKFIKNFVQEVIDDYHLMIIDLIIID